LHVDARKMIGKIVSVEPILTNSRAYNSRQCPLEKNCLPDSLVLEIVVIVNAGYRNGQDVSNIAVSTFTSM